MKTVLTFSALLLFVAFSTAQEVPLSNFSNLEVRGPFNIILVPDGKHQAVITEYTGQKEDIVITQDGNELEIRWKKSMFRGKNRNATIELHYSTISSLDVSAGAMVQSDEDLQGAALEIECSSGAVVQLPVAVETIEIETSSGSKVEVTGSANSADLEASSGSVIKSHKLIAEHVSGEASSGSSIKCQATKSITAEATSGASIKYAGEPAKKDYDRKSRSGGSIKPM